MSEALKWLNNNLSRHLDDIRSYFRDERVITLVIRDPNDTDQSSTVVIGNDAPDDAIAAIEWSKRKERDT